MVINIIITWKTAQFKLDTELARIDAVIGWPIDNDEDDNAGYSDRCHDTAGDLAAIICSTIINIKITIKNITISLHFLTKEIKTEMIKITKIQMIIVHGKLFVTWWQVTRDDLQSQLLALESNFCIRNWSCRPIAALSAHLVVVVVVVFVGAISSEIV